jgi:hypothetical protein
MNPESAMQNLQRISAAMCELSGKGFTYTGGWIFTKNDQYYDLGAADLTQIDKIEREGLFLVDNPLETLIER